MDGKRAMHEPRIVLIFLDSAREKFRYKKVHIENFLSLTCSKAVNMYFEFEGVGCFENE